jgi:hypothetical protein
MQLNISSPFETEQYSFTDEFLFFYLVRKRNFLSSSFLLDIKGSDILTCSLSKIGEIDEEEDTADHRFPIMHTSIKLLIWV